MKLLESIMLDYLSDLTNIETCDIFPDGNHLTFDDNSNGHNWLFPQVDLSNETIIGLASSPLDSVDNDRCKSTLSLISFLVILLCKCWLL
jgi:hypothetical protein